MTKTEKPAKAPKAKKTAKEVVTTKASKKRVSAMKPRETDENSTRATSQQLSLKVLSADGKEVGTIDLNPDVFGVEVNASLVHDTVRWQLARRRAGTHSALTRSMMEGGKKKPWKQKHTGRARAGSSVSPHWVGGATVHRPSPRDYDYRLPKRTRRQALASVLSDKVLGQKLIVIDELKLQESKTKFMAALLSKIGVLKTSAVIVVPANDESVMRSSRNLAKVLTLSVAATNVYDLLRHDFLLCTKDGVKALEERVLRG